MELYRFLPESGVDRRRAKDCLQGGKSSYPSSPAVGQGAGAGGV